jgi:hypothetical protein
MEYAVVPLNLTHEQGMKLVRGKPVQLRHHQLLNGPHQVVLAIHKAKKLHKAHSLSKGCRLHLSPQEVEMSGQGLGDFFKKVGKFYTEKIKPYVAPLVKQGVSSLADLGVSAAKTALPMFAPELQSLSDRYKDQAVSKLGEVTGAYGMRRSGRGLRNEGNMLGPNHPAMFPAIMPAPGDDHRYAKLEQEMRDQDMVERKAIAGTRGRQAGGRVCAGGRMKVGGRVGKLIPQGMNHSMMNGGSFRPSGY